MRNNIALLSFALLASWPAYAQQLSPKQGDAPLEISADGTLEWDRANHKYFARKNAVAKQGDAQIAADLLTADYREGKDGQTEIYHLRAEGNVVLTSAENKAYGDQADYDVDQAKAVLTGKNLRMTGPDMNVTAKERFEYYVRDGRIVAIGSPVITNKGDQLKADKVTAWTAQGDEKQKAAKDSAADSKMGNLKRAEAEGHVVISNGKDQATADRAVYNGATNTTNLDGNVKLTQDKNTLEGAKAQMDMTTKVSKMTAGDANGGRVKGIFYPKKKNSLADAEILPTVPMKQK